MSGPIGDMLSPGWRQCLFLRLPVVPQCLAVNAHHRFPSYRCRSINPRLPSRCCMAVLRRIRGHSPDRMILSLYLRAGAMHDLCLCKSGRKSSDYSVSSSSPLLQPLRHTYQRIQVYSNIKTDRPMRSDC